MQSLQRMVRAKKKGRRLGVRKWRLAVRGAVANSASSTIQIRIQNATDVTA